MKKLFILLLATTLSACSFGEDQYKSVVPAKTSQEIIKKNLNDSLKPFAAAKPLPESINLDVTFYAQAPDGDWSAPWKEACEEASLVQALYFVKNKPLSKDMFRQEILNLVSWQSSAIGWYEDTTIAETARMLKEHYGHQNYKIIEDPTIEDMKKALVNGHPIVAPFAGRELGNPYFSGDGPYYHMLVIKGYDKEHFITNDVGTRRGENFNYTYETIMSAMHDFHTDGIQNGEKRILIVQP